MTPTPEKDRRPASLWKSMTETQRLAAAKAFWADDESLAEQTEVMLLLAKKLNFRYKSVESMADDWRPKDYRDTYTERVNKLIKDKQKGREVVVEAEPPEATGVVDLMEALQRSVEASKKKRGGTKKKAG